MIAHAHFHALPFLTALPEITGHRAVQQQGMARDLKFRIKEVGELYHLCSENKGADQLCAYRTADLRLCFRICKKPVSHDEA